MYCGDETGAFVGDCGLTSSRFGFGGEDCPKLVLPSHIKKSASSSSSFSAPDVDAILSYPSQSSPITPLPSEEDYMKNDTGLISSFSAWETTWEKAFSTLHIKKDASNTPHPILAIDDSMLLNSSSGNSSNNNHPLLKPGTDRHQRETMLETFFEKWDAPAVFLAPSPMLQAFSMGRQTALVVDMGGGGCRATPVIDGLVCNMSQRRNGRGGEWLSEIQLQILKQVNEIPDIQHRHMLKMKEQRKRQETTTTESNPLNEAEGSAALLDSQYNSSLFHRLALLELMYEIKTGDHVNVPESSFEEGSRGTRLQYPTKKQKMEKEGMILNDQSSDVNDKQIYELPDGTIIDLDNSEGSGILCDLPELLFCADPLYCSKLSSTPKAFPSDPLQRLIHSSISSVDIDARKELCGNILLCGAHSLFPNLEKRLSHEISNLVSSTFKCRVIAPRNSMERRFASWIGASVLTSLGSFQQLWLSKTEYEEYGATLACQRFP